MPPRTGLSGSATPKDIVDRLNAEIARTVQCPELRKRLDEIGAEPVGSSQQAMAQQIRQETEKFARLVKESNVPID